MQNCGENDPPCPIVLIERLGLELKKRFYETEIQILVSPSFLISSDTILRPSKEKHLKQGHLLLSAVQVRKITRRNIQDQFDQMQNIHFDRYVDMPHSAQKVVHWKKKRLNMRGCWKFNLENCPAN